MFLRSIPWRITLPQSSIVSMLQCKLVVSLCWTTGSDSVWSSFLHGVLGDGAADHPEEEVFPSLPVHQQQSDGQTCCLSWNHETKSNQSYLLGSMERGEKIWFSFVNLGEQILNACPHPFIHSNPQWFSSADYFLRCNRLWTQIASIYGLLHGPLRHHPRLYNNQCFCCQDRFYYCPASLEAKIENRQKLKGEKRVEEWEETGANFIFQTLTCVSRVSCKNCSPLDGFSCSLTVEETCCTAAIQ